MIEIQNLTCTYGKTTALDSVSFKIRNGHIYGLIGAAGAGKTTVLHLITGCLKPTAGTVLVNGYDMRKSPLEAKRQLGYFPEGMPLFLDMTPVEYLTFVAEAKGVKDEVLDRQVRDILTLTELTHVKNTLVRQLPEGTRRRVGVAQALLGNPDIVIFDEPMEGLDPAALRELRALIRRIGEKMTVVVSAATVAELGGMCDHVITLEAGKVISDEDVEVTPAETDAPAEAEEADTELSDPENLDPEELDTDILTDAVPDETTEEEVSD